jgi:hypothetical protein
MKFTPFLPTLRRQGGGAVIAYLIVALVVMATIGALATLVVHSLSLGQRRDDMVNAFEFAQAGAAIGVSDVQVAYTNSKSTFYPNLLKNISAPYKQNKKLSTPDTVVVEKTIANVFTNQSVLVRVAFANSTYPTKVTVSGIAQSGKVAQTVNNYVEAEFGPGAAIISTDAGNLASGASKTTAQAGNVSITGKSSDTLRVDGGVLANGSVNTNGAFTDTISKNLYGTAQELPDYTNPGSTNQLFDFNQFIAAADASLNHYTNLDSFITAQKTGAFLEGIVVVDISKGGSLPSLSPTTLPKGINIRGTLVFNFIGGWSPTDKIVNTADININPAKMAGFKATVPSSYPSGYPPVYTDQTKNPTNLTITPKFMAGDDLPALMYNNAVLDIHGACNISGAIYSPAFVEIENKENGQLQYIRGCIIGGSGIFLENNQTATTVVSYDPFAIKHLATAGTKAKVARVIFRD